MPLSLWIILYLVTAAIWIWLLIGRNADRYSGSGFLVYLLRDFWGASYNPGCLRLVAWIGLISETIIFILGINDPKARSFWDLF
jgi:hypothetical protein